MNESERIPNIPPEKLKITLFHRIVCPLIKWSIKTLITVKFRAPFKILQDQKIPRSGGLLIFSNHISNSDPVLVQIACRRHINFMARRELFAMKGIAPFVKFWKAFPVSQSTSDSAAIKTALALLKKGHAVCVFPEGQLSPTGDIIDLLPGASLLVRKSGAPCSCVGIQNTNKLMPYPETEARIANAPLIAKWGDPKLFQPKSEPHEIMDWINTELHQLTGQQSNLETKKPSSHSKEEGLHTESSKD